MPEKVIKVQGQRSKKGNPKRTWKKLVEEGICAL